MRNVGRHSIGEFIGVITSVRLVRLIDQGRLLFWLHLSTGSKLLTCLLCKRSTAEDTWVGVWGSGMQVWLKLRGAILFHTESTATCQKDRKPGWICSGKWWLCCCSGFNWKRKSYIPKPDDRPLIKTTRMTSKVIQRWNPPPKLLHADVPVTGNICPESTPLKAVEFCLLQWKHVGDETIRSYYHMMVGGGFFVKFLLHSSAILWVLRSSPQDLLQDHEAV